MFASRSPSPPRRAMMPHNTSLTPSILFAVGTFVALSWLAVLLASSTPPWQSDSSSPSGASKGSVRIHSRYAPFFQNPSEAVWAKEGFLERNRLTYGYNERIDSLVASSLKRMEGHVYLDYTGAGVYSEELIHQVSDDLMSHLYGNTHSRSPSSEATEERVEAVRARVLDFCNASPDEYSVVFTSGATGALKLVGESFPWTHDSHFLYTRVNHNSVLGIRELAKEAGASFTVVSDDEIEAAMTKDLVTRRDEGPFHLFAYPAEDNFAGVVYPLEWVNQFQSGQLGSKWANRGKWMVFLDAAAFVPTQVLDLSKYPADFVAISFYKIFGFPTGVGALVVRNDALEHLHKRYFGGGSVVLALCERDFKKLVERTCARFEDGTPNFLSIIALEFGFRILESLGGIPAVSLHVNSLREYLYDELSNIVHSNGAPIAKIYGSNQNGGPQGSIVTFNFLTPSGDYIGYYEVQEVAADHNIHLRTGCLCNPGACYGYLGIKPEEVEEFSRTKCSCSDETDLINGKPLGAVRLSLGYLSTFEDVQAFLEFTRNNYVR